MTAAAAATVAPAGAQERRRRLGILVGRANPSIEGFDEGLREFGWIDGRNIAFERRLSNGGREQTRILAAELAGLDLDAIYANTTQSASALHEISPRSPVVFSMLADPVELGWVAGFARPTGNITGVAGVDTREITGKRIEILLDAVPGVRRIGLMHTPGLTNTAPALQGSDAAARTLGVELRAVAIERDADLEPALADLRAWGAQAVVVTQSQLLATQPLQGRIIALVAAAGLPAIYGEPDWVDVGGLMTYVPDAREMGRRAAWFMNRILRGAKPAELPIERPSRILLRINLRAARAIALDIPHALLARADEVIE